MNINDYLRWRGDIPLKNDLNEADRLILARIAYLRFDKIDLSPRETLASACRKMSKLPSAAFYWPDDKDFVENLIKSPRFSHLYLTHHEKNTNRSVEKQFEAITIHLKPRELYIAFMGTDATLAGWKEDFNMSFLPEIPAQIDALEYTKKIAKKYRFAKLRLGGHSKGGTVAIYSALKAPQSLQNRILSVDNYDGPGLNEELIKLDKNPKILKKITTFIPQGSIIGRLFTHSEPVKIVKSTAKGLLQHDIYSWQVLGPTLVREEKLTSNSEIINKTLMTWLKSASLAERKLFIDGVYEILNSTNDDTVLAFIAHWPKKIPTVFKSYRSLPEKDRTVVNMMVGEFFKSAKAAIFKK